MEPRPLSLLLAAGLLAFALVLGSGSGRAASLARDWTLADAVARADLIAYGRVVAVQYRDPSDADESGLAAPHTFVTYRIERVLRGRYDAATLTLRVMGGYSPGSGRVMLGAHTPMFRAKDRDLLFVAGNGAALCPLVGCGLGRFRVVDDKVYGDTGLAVRSDRAGGLRFGPDALPTDALTVVVPPAPPGRLDALRTHLNDPGLAPAQRRRLEARLAAMSEARTLALGRVRAEPIPAPPSPPMSLSSFVALVQRLAEGRPPPERTVESADPDAPIRIPAPEATEVRRSDRPARQPPRDREQRLLDRNGGNPVLRPAQ